MKVLAREFLDFLKHYGVIGLAIAVVIGGKLNEFVTSIVNDLITPLILQPALRAAQVDDIKKLSYGGVLYGKVISSLLDFILVAGFVFLAIKYILKTDPIPPKK